MAANQNPGMATIRVTRLAGRVGPCGVPSAARAGSTSEARERTREFGPNHRRHDLQGRPLVDTAPEGGHKPTLVSCQRGNTRRVLLRQENDAFIDLISLDVVTKNHR
jgi:hypothetical protein